MKIITHSINKFLANASHTVGVGLITGPIRIISAIAQIALNSIALIFTSLPTALGYLKKNPFNAKILLNDAKIGFLHIKRGVLEFLPGTSLDKSDSDIRIILETDHPFDGLLDI